MTKTSPAAIILTLMIGACGSDGMPTTTTTTTTTTTGMSITPASCVDRCVKKGTSCGESLATSQQVCPQICGTNPTEQQISCAEAASCSDPDGLQRCFGGGGGGDCTAGKNACKYSTDCPTNQNCNTKQERCFATNATCVGTPCQYSTDCPSGETCNTAMGICN